MGSLSGVPVMIVTTHRSGYTVRWADKPYYTQIALDGLARLGTTTRLAWGQGLLATCLVALDECDTVPGLCEEAIRLAEATRDRLANALAHRILAEALDRLTPRDVARAERAMLDAIRIHEELGSRPELARSYLTYGRLLKRWSRAEEARTHVAEASGMFRQMGMARDLAEAEQEAAGPA